MDSSQVSYLSPQVSDRVLIASATMTATLNLLERRGWIRRIPNPADRRSVLVEITPAGRATADQLLPGIRSRQRAIVSILTADERVYLLRMLAKLPARTADVATDQQPERFGGPHVRPARLSPTARAVLLRGSRAESEGVQPPGYGGRPMCYPGP